ncbi:MAG: hypothetical protein HW376_420 [candidate division NC10 bacterium]|nr:hypothetical protein [candidate division NC10 bacterium]
MENGRRVWARVGSWAAENWPVPLLWFGLWVARYWHSAGFGLYEDDLTHLPSAVQMAWPEVGAFISDVILHFRGSGHPLHLVFQYVLGAAGWRLGGLWGLYLVGYALICLNTFLFFKLVQRIGGTALAGLSGLAYVIYSADTTQAFLTYSFGIQTALAMVLLAFHAFVRGRSVLALILSALAILTYETTFLVLLAAPLLLSPWDREWRNVAWKYVAGILLILFADVAVRIVAGDQRVGGLEAGTVLQLPFLHMLQGPPVALGTYLYRPIQALQTLDGEKIGMMAIGFVLVLAAFAVASRLLGGKGLASVPSDPLANLSPRSRLRAMAGKLPADIRWLARPALAGLVMLVLAYPLTFTVRAYAITGRDTRVHAAGVLGAGLLCGSIMIAGLILAKRRPLRLGGIVLIAVWAGMMAGFGLDVQRDYLRAWQLQRTFWQGLVPLLPDVTDGTVVLVDPEVLEDTRQIGANYWNLPRVLGKLYAFPVSWKAVPRTFRMVPGWRDRVLTQDGKLRLDASTTFSPPSTYGEFDPENAILIVPGPTGLARLTEFTAGETQSVGLKPAEGVGEPPYPRDFLYTLLIEPPG